MEVWQEAFPPHVCQALALPFLPTVAKVRGQQGQPRWAAGLLGFANLTEPLVSLTRQQEAAFG